jgi:pilus assembly protein CpaE
MTRNTRQDTEELPNAATEPAGDHIAPVPRISVQAFCETEDTATAIRSAGEDRRLGKAHLTVKMGGIAKATEVYQTVPTPNVIVLETDGRSDILDSLDHLAGVCDPGTRVIVIGSPEDDVSYRELVRRGINDYIVGPIEPLDAIRSICSLFSASDAVPTGRIIAVVGAKGGVGASTIAHNVAWTIARDLALDSVVIDLDLAFGTASLDYNKDPLQGIANAVFQPDRPDTALMERLFAKCADNLNLLAAPATLERVYDFGAEAFDAIFDTLRMSTPCIVLDVPHQWSAWTKRVLISADEILVVAEPDLANLRNAKNLLKELKTSRPNDRSPLYCINQIGLPKRPEITVKEFAKAMESPPIAAIPFDSRIFGMAANNGQMIAELSAMHRTTKIFLQMANVLTGRSDNKRPQRSLLSPLIRKFREKFAPRRAARASARQ